MRMNRHNAQLLIVDMQEKVLPPVRDAELVAAACGRLILFARRLEVPITFSEHYPKGIGATLAALRDQAGEAAVVCAKMHFSGWDDPGLRARLEGLRAAGRDQVVVAGIEAHVCVAQTALDLAAAGYRTFVVADAVSSRAETSRSLALDRLRQARVVLVDCEMVMFEWLGRAGTPEFKALLPFIK